MSYMETQRDDNEEVRRIDAQATESGSAINSVVGTRKYRSKTQRPCDLCRARKVHCHIQHMSKPCQLCQRTGRACTFLAKPSRKTRERLAGNPQEDLNDDDNSPPAEEFEPRILQQDSPRPWSAEHLENNESMPMDMDISDTQHALAPDETLDSSLLGMGDESYDFDCDEQQIFNTCLDLADLQNTDYGLINEARINSQLPGSRSLATSAVSITNGIPPIDSTSGHHVPRLLDSRNNFSYQMFGYCGETDPFMLERFPHNSVGEVEFLKLIYRNLNPRPDQSTIDNFNYSPPAHFLGSNRETTIGPEKFLTACLSGKIEPETDRGTLNTLVNHDFAASLVILFQKYVFFALPVFSRSQTLCDVQKFVASGPVGLLAAIYALALPFLSWDEKLCVDQVYSKPNLEELWALAYRSIQKEMVFPKLSTIQTCLLILHCPVFELASANNPAVWSLACSTLALSQTLGLNMDCTAWHIPPWEIRLRRRLWWTLFVEHSWRATTHGQMSMIAPGTWSVSVLTYDDFTLDQPIPDMRSTAHADYLMRLCSLTMVMDEICRLFYFVNTLPYAQSLDYAMTNSRAPRYKLQQWFSTLPISLQADHIRDEPAVAGSLYSAYYTVHCLLFRALLRPIISVPRLPKDHDPRTQVMTILQACGSFLQTMIDFTRKLQVDDYSSFWPTYQRVCLAYPGQLAFMLCFQKHDDALMEEHLKLLNTWRSLLRARAQVWPMLRFAALKVDAIFWKELHKSI